MFAFYVQSCCISLPQLLYFTIAAAAATAVAAQAAVTQATPECGRRADFVVPNFIPTLAVTITRLTVINKTPGPVAVYHVPSPSQPANFMGTLASEESVLYMGASGLWFITDTNDNILFVRQLEECYVVVNNSDEIKIVV